MKNGSPRFSGPKLSDTSGWLIHWLSITGSVYVGSDKGALSGSEAHQFIFCCTRVLMIF